MEEVNLDHEYFQFSTKIIDLILSSKQHLIPQMGLDLKVQLNEVYYEEPMDDAEFLRDVQGASETREQK